MMTLEIGAGRVKGCNAMIHTVCLCVCACTHVQVYMLSSQGQILFSFLHYQNISNLLQMTEGRTQSGNILMASSQPVGCLPRLETNEAGSSFVFKNIIITRYTPPSAWVLVRSSPKVKSNTRARERWKDLDHFLNGQCSHDSIISGRSR